jgi:DNA-directed RNA polymerase subunit K/omega
MADEDYLDDIDSEPEEVDLEAEEISDTEEGNGLTVSNKVVYGVGDSRRVTSNQMTKYEKVGLIGKRAKSLEADFAPIDNRNKFTDAMDIAIDEFIRGIMPLNIVRDLGNGITEIWSVAEMIPPKE